MNFRSIRVRLLVWYAGLLAVIFLLLCGLFYLDLRHFLENDLRQTESFIQVLSGVGEQPG